MRLAGRFYREFAELPQLPADVDEVACHVHALGRIVGVRAAHRAHPDLVSNKGRRAHLIGASIP